MSFHSHNITRGHYAKLCYAIYSYSILVTIDKYILSHTLAHYSHSMSGNGHA